MERTHRQPVFLEGMMDCIIIIIIVIVIHSGKCSIYHTDVVSQTSAFLLFTAVRTSYVSTQNDHMTHLQTNVPHDVRGSTCRDTLKLSTEAQYLPGTLVVDWTL